MNTYDRHAVPHAPDREREPVTHQTWPQDDDQQDSPVHDIPGYHEVCFRI